MHCTGCVIDLDELILFLNIFIMLYFENYKALFTTWCAPRK